MCKISVVIPTYNRAKYVTKAIDSVLAQNFNEIEIIVVDDGSTDNTKEVLLSYKNKIKYIYQENKGVSSARNKGILESQGEWIAFLDSDDEWLPGKLTKQIEDLKNYPSAVLSCTNIIFEQEGKCSINHYESCLPPRVNKIMYVKTPDNIKIVSSHIMTSTVIVNSKVLSTVGLFNEELSLFEDLDLWLRLSVLGGFVLNPNVFVKGYRRAEMHSLNLSIQYQDNNKKESNYKNLIEIYRKILCNPIGKDQKQIIEQRLSELWFDLGMFYFNNENKMKAKECFNKSIAKYLCLRSIVKYIFTMTGNCGVRYILYCRKNRAGYRRSNY